MEKYLGIDIGGTKIAIGIYDENSTLICKTKVPTFGTSSRDEFISWLKSIIKDFLAENNIDKLDAIGIGIPGITNNGIIVSLPNIPCIQNCPLEQILSEEFNCKVLADNDANLAGLAQYKLLNRTGNMVYITISTGIGAGIILDGKIFKGDSGSAGEAGHMLTGRPGFKCGCGNEGCYEVMASGGNLTKKVEKACGNGETGMLIDIYKQNGSVGGSDVYNCYLKGDKLAQSLIEESGRLLGELCYNIYILLNIKTFCIGGGITGWGQPLFDAMHERFNSLNHLTDKDVSFLKAFNSDDAGILGAASLVF